MNTPKYTFLLPAYKAKFFEEALRSIKNQTYKDFMCIVSDDCSPEDLKIIYDSVIGDDPRFTFRRNAENMGGKSLVSHWNILVDMCHTEYLIMASDDDVYDSVFLDVADSLLQKYPEVNILRGRTRCIDPNGEPTVEEHAYPEKLDSIHFVHRMTQNDWIGGIGSFVYNTKNLKNKGKFIDFPSAWFSDYVSNIMMADNGCCISSETIFKVRFSDLQISTQWGNAMSSRSKLQATLMYCRWMKDYFKHLDCQSDLEFTKSVKLEVRQQVKCSVNSYIYNCNFFDFFRFLLSFSLNLRLNHVRMVAHYLRNSFVSSRNVL